MSTHRTHLAAESAPQTQGTVLNWGRLYDLIVRVSTGGKEQALRRKIADLIGLQPGKAVLDVGCGTGSLALLAKKHVGETGRVCGVDPGPRQIARARAKAEHSRLSVDFQVGVIERLPFPDHSFDVVQSTFMIDHLTHMIDHLTHDLQRQGVKEIARVLKPGWRSLILVSTSI